jgi:hypothetical protein
MRHPLIGQLMRPGNGNVPFLDVWAADNGAYAGFDAEPFVAMLERLRAFAGCRWVACPDVVGDAAATLRLFAEWAPRIRELGYRVAWVAQDGATPQTAPWADLDCVFIGGSTAWKLSRESLALCEAAKRRGKWLHVGRVNRQRRTRWAFDAGADSIDGTGFSRWPDTLLPGAVRYLERLQSQGRLFV